MRNDSLRSYPLTALGLAAAFSLLALPVQAQDRDARWLPFVGCWEAVGAEEEIGLLCFTPSDGGVELSNIVAGDVVSTERLAADGQRRDISAEGCEGWETVEFSADGRRAFTRTEFSCAEGDVRAGTGVMAFTAPNFWVDVRVLEVGGEEVAWAQEYLLADTDRLAEEGVSDPAAELGMAVRSARMAAAAPIGLDDVEEASARMGERAVETWVVAQGDELDPDADDLVRLAEAGVPDRVIDAVVAISHPDRFLVQAGAPVEQLEDRVRPRGYRGYMGFNPWAGSAWGFGYDYGPFGLGYSRYGYSPRHYGFGGYGYGYWGYRPGYVIIDRRPAQSGGRMYNGRGYSRGSTTTGTTGRIARPRGGAQPSYGTGSAGRGSGSVAPSRGSTPRSTGRKAKPRRPPGGGS